MSGMEVLGRNANIIPAADGVVFKMRESSVAMVVCSTASTGTFTVNEAAGFAGTPAAITVIKNIYWTTSAGGTAAWSKITYLNGSGIYASGPLSAISLGAGGTAGLTTATVAVFHVFTSELSDPDNYVQIVGSGTSHSVIVVTSDLVHQRGPANLPIMSS